MPMGLIFEFSLMTLISAVRNAVLLNSSQVSADNFVKLYDVMGFLPRCAKAPRKVDKYYKQECIPVGCIPATH